MTRTIIVAGYGLGISKAVAERFGREGFSVALVARNREKLDAGVEALKAQGIDAAAFQAEMGDPDAIRTMVEQVLARFGDITVLHWNVPGNGKGGGNLLTATPEDIQQALAVPVIGLMLATQACLPALERAEKPAILVTNGGAEFDLQFDEGAIAWESAGPAMAQTAKRRLAGLLGVTLRPKDIFVGEVGVLGLVKGTDWDTAGHADIDPADIAECFWKLYTDRDERRVVIRDDMDLAASGPQDQTT